MRSPSLALVLLVVSHAVSAQPAEVAPADETTPATTVRDEPSFALPALEIVGFDFLLNRYNRRFSGTSDYDVTLASIRRNLHGPWVVDNDPFKVNQFAHPYQGSLYHGAGRSVGLGYWQSAALTFAGSAAWEIAGEKTPPSRNDQVASGIAGSFLGEPLFRMAHLALKDGSSVPAAWRPWVATAISPAVGLNRLLLGPGHDNAFADHDPAYYGRLHLGYTHVTRHPFDTPTKFNDNMAQADFVLDYGLPGKPGYTYERPFDYFNFRTLFSSANGVESLSVRGLLYGTDYAVGDDYRGLWGLYGNYDYLAPQIFHVSDTSLSLGTTGQWWATQTIALQGTVLAGLGYGAASTTRNPVSTDEEYHYGMASRAALALRLIEGNRTSFDVSAQFVSLGRITSRAGRGRDEVADVDSTLTWRIKGQHAIGIDYRWSHRSASFPVVGARRQSLGKIGIYYTMLSRQGLGAVDWRASGGQ